MSAESRDIVGQVIGGLFMTFGIVAALVLFLGWLLRPTIEQEGVKEAPTVPRPPAAVVQAPQMASTTTMTITTTRWAVPSGYVLASAPPAGQPAWSFPAQRRSGGDPHSEEIRAEPEPRTS